MKKWFSMLLPLFVLVVLCGACGEAAGPTSKSVEIDGLPAVITVDPGAPATGKVSTEKGEYTFSREKNGDITIVYPDGSVYEERGGVIDYSRGDGEIPSDGQESEYLEGFFLVHAIEEACDSADGGKGVNWPVLLAAVVLIAAGLGNLCAPESAWFFSHGWRYKNAEPSDAALGLNRAGGGVLIIIGIICLFFALFAA